MLRLINKEHRDRRLNFGAFHQLRSLAVDHDHYLKWPLAALARNVLQCVLLYRGIYAESLASDLNFRETNAEAKCKFNLSELK